MTETDNEDCIKALADIYMLYARTCDEEVSDEEAIQFIKNHLRQEAEHKAYKNRWQLRIKELIVNRGKV